MSASTRPCWIEKPLPKPEPVVYKAPEPPKQEEPVSLFDQPAEEEKPVVLSKDVIAIKGTRNGESFFVDDELMINVMVISKKEIKNQLLNDWSNLKRYIAHPTLGKAASLLVDGRPLVASPKVLVVEYQLPTTAERANLIENQEAIQNVIETVFGKKMFVYGVSRKDSVRSQQNYMNKLQISKLPKPDTVNIEFEGE